MKDDGTIILNTANPEKYKSITHQLITLDATKLALEIIGRPITNVAMLGAFIGATGEKAELAAAGEAIRSSFSTELAIKNEIVLSRAYRKIKGVE